LDGNGRAIGRGGRRARRRPALARVGRLAFAFEGTDDAGAQEEAFRKVAQAFLAWRVRTGRVGADVGAEGAGEDL